MLGEHRIYSIRPIVTAYAYAKDLEHPIYIHSMKNNINEREEHARKINDPPTINVNEQRRCATSF